MKNIFTKITIVAVILLSLFFLFLLAFDPDFNLHNIKMDRIERLEKKSLEGSEKALNKLFEFSSSDGENRLVRGRAFYALGKTIVNRHKKGILDSVTFERVVQLRKYKELIEPYFWLQAQIPNMDSKIIEDGIETLFKIKEYDGNKASLLGHLLKLITETNLIDEKRKVEVLGNYITTIAIPGTERYSDRVWVYFQIKDSLSEVNDVILEAMKNDLTNDDLRIPAALAYRHFTNESDAESNKP